MSGGSPSRELVIRPLASQEDYEACTAFQEEIWGVGFNERVSAAILMVANRIGGLSAGAFDEEGVLQGFVFGLTGIEGGELIHWSDMLAVRAGLRDQGLGTRLKHYQREVLLSRGVRRMRWTFDPLQSRNAYVNLAKLGIITREYVQDMYGDTGSPLHRGVGTDRLIAFWEMDSDRATRRLKGTDVRPDAATLAALPMVIPTRGGGDYPAPEEPVLGLDGPALLLTIPGEIDSIMAEDPGLAVRWREVTRSAFLHYFSRGYRAMELIPQGEISHYVLAR